MSNQNSDLEQERLGEIDYKKGYLTLPFSQDQFREFISGLFGKPEQLTREISGNFEIELGDIKNFYYLIEDRIAQQNQGSLVQFSAQIFYNDNSSILLNNFVALSNYVEPRPVIPVKVELNWQYLIQFNDRNVPEKQEIELYITTNSHSFSGVIHQGRFINHYPNFSLNIKYTARTWATDIDYMLTEHIKSLLKSPSYRNRSRWQKFVFNNHEITGWISGIIFFIASVLGSFIATNKFIKSKLISNASFFSENSNINEKIDFLVKNTIEGGISRFYFFLAIFLLIMLVASIFVGNIISEQADKHVNQSFILLTRRAEKEKTDTLRMEKNHWRNFLLSIALAIFTNILSNYIFMYLTIQK
ncbi:MAG: hypothetical protein F6J86_38920 [Symploca sp. SIO1B1]|nr:hypothetical protein [Symploca sp. SIO1B1]